MAYAIGRFSDQIGVKATLTHGEADRHDEREVAVGNIGWRWRKGRGTLHQIERRGIENGRPELLTILLLTTPLAINSKGGGMRLRGVKTISQVRAD